MTLAIIIARKKDFIIIADSRQEGAHPLHPNDHTKCIYHDQEQKVFHSSRQRIGLCISGNAVLTHDDPSLVNDPSKQVLTSFAVREYFTSLENRAEGNLYAEDVYSDINNYVSKKYPDYLKSFEKVILLYGGFDKNYNTEIYLCRNGILDSYKYSTDSASSNKVCTFSNCTANKQDLSHVITRQLINDSKSKEILKKVFSLDLNANNEVENQNKLLCYHNFSVPLSGLIPLYRDSVHNDYGRDTYIGKYFDCYKINTHLESTSNTHHAFYINTSNKLERSIPLFAFKYSMAKTPDDLESDRQSKIVNYYDEKHAPLVLQQQTPTPF